MNRARRTSNLNNILTYDTLGNSTLIANLTVEGLTGAGFVKADAAGLLSVDTAAYTVTTGATNYLPKITAPNTLGQSLVYDNGTSVLVNTAVGVPGYSHAFQVMANGAGGLVVSTTDVASAIGIVNSSSANKTWDISPYGNHLVINESGIATRMKFDAGGNITIGDITNTGHKLEVVGSFRTTGTNTLSALQGVGDRMVVANTNGVLTTQPIPTGSITGTGAAGQVNFWTGTTTVSGSNNLFWDNANSSLGVGTNTPAYPLHINGTSVSAPNIVALFDSQVNHERIAIGSVNTGIEHKGSEQRLTIFNSNASALFTVDLVNTRRLALFTSGNLVLQNGGTFTDSGQRLQVIGDTLLRGTGNTSATTALTVQNSSSVNILRVLNDGQTILRGTTNNDTTNIFRIEQQNGNGRFLVNANGQTIISSDAFASSETFVTVSRGNFNPTSGTATHTSLAITPTINQTGGANGITRGLYVNPTLTAAADWRSIQWDNNTGYGLYGEGTAPNLIKGNLIIGPSALNQASADSSLHIGRAMNAQSTHGATIRYEAQSGVIAAHGLNISLSTQDAAFTISNIYGVSVTATIKGASNTITNQYGFFVSSTFTAATNNYAYWGDIPAGANRWNLYMNGTANNYLAGSLGVGSNALTGYGFRNNKQLTGSSTSIGNGAEGQIQTDVSVAAYYYRTISNQIVGTSITSIIHYGATQGTLSGVSNNQYGFYAFDLSVSTANYGFYGALTSGANKWNLYMNGTANNYMNGALLLGNTTTDGANKLQVTGSSALNGVTYVNTNASIAGYGHSLQVLANASGGMIVSTTNSASAIGIVNSASSNKTWDISPFNNDLSFNESGVGARMYLSAGGRIGLGIAPVTLDNATVTIGGNVTTGTGPSALLISPTVQSTATSSAVYSLVRSSTQAASFVLPSLFYYFTSEGTFGAGSSVTSQYGYYANGNMTGATNNYGFYGAIPAGTGRWNLYMNGDAHNYLAGNVGIGSGGTNDLVKLYIVGSTTGTTIYNFAYAQPQISTSLSSGLFVFRSNVSGTGTASTTESITHFIAQQSSLGSATVTNQYGFRVDTGLTGATNNYGFYGNTASGTNRWNLYMAGTASNHLNGTTLIGTATDDGVNKLQVAGSIKATGILRSDITQAAVTNNVSISLLGSNITTYAAGFSMANAGYGLNAVYAQHEQRFGGNATFAHGNINGAGLMLNKLAPTAAGTVTITQQTGQLRTMSNLHLMTQFEGNNNLTVTDMSGLHIYGHYRTSGTGTLTVSNAYYGVFLADPNEFGAGATVTGSNYGFYQQGAAPYNYFGGKVSIGTTATDGTSKLRISGLPTSATGLLAGEVWNDAGTLKIA